MSQTASGLLGNPLFISLSSLVVGSIIGIVVTKILNKTGIFRFTVHIERVALAAEDPIFGSVKVKWQESDVRNLYTTMIQVENTTTRDYEKIKLRVFTDDKTFLLDEQTGIVASTYILEWTEKFRDEMAVPKGEQPTQAQFDRYSHNREYLVPVFNRGQKLELLYLCTRPDDDRLPGVFIDTLTRGIKLKYQAAMNLVIGIPDKIALWRGLVICSFVVIACGLFLRDLWPAVIISMVAGLHAQILGALEYKVEKKIRSMVSG